jgi:pimeloyl-ACP methyl ester carboxylesterase
VTPDGLVIELFEQLPGPREFVAIPGADHNDFFDPANGAYWEPVSRFIGALR